MQVVLAGDLADGLQPSGRFQRCPQLKLGVVLSAFPAHAHASTSGSDSIPIHLSLWSHFRGAVYLHDIAVRILLKLLKYDDTYYPTIRYDDDQPVDWVNEDTTARLLGYW